MYHDVPEIITGDLPTPVKYFDPTIKKSYDVVESVAVSKLLNSMPEEMRAVYENILDEKNIQIEYRKIVKAADKISALIKCIEERKMGNQDFARAENSTIAAIRKLECREANYFLDNYIEAYGLTLDEQT
jgi:5'-deoxynucleotidase